MLFEKIKLDEDEKIIKIVRKHWFLLFVESFFVFLAAGLPFIIGPIFRFLLPEVVLPMELIDVGNQLALTATWLLLLWLVVAYIWTDYYLDLWVITTKRVVVIEQKGLFYREIGSFRLERLQDMQVTINGLIATFLDFGTVEAETASGSAGEFRVAYLPQPRELKSLILEAADRRMNLGDEGGV